MSPTTEALVWRNVAVAMLISAATLSGAYAFAWVCWQQPWFGYFAWGAAFGYCAPFGAAWLKIWWPEFWRYGLQRRDAGRAEERN